MIPKMPCLCCCPQCRGGDAERLPPAVLPAVQEEPHAAAVSSGDPHPGPGAQPDGGRGGHRALRGALHPGKVASSLGARRGPKAKPAGIESLRN